MLTGVHYNTAGARVASSVKKAPSAPKVSFCFWDSFSQAVFFSDLIA